METQKLFMFLITAILALTLVSAADFSLSTNPVILTQSSSSDVVTISGNASEVTVLTQPTALTDAIGTTITPTVSPVSGQTINIAANGNVDYDNLYIGKSTYTSSIIVGNATNNNTLTIQYMNSFCSNGSVNDTQLELAIDIDVDSEGDGDEDSWYPRDIVEVDVDFDNDLTDLDNVYFELGLIDVDGDDIAEDLDWISGDEKEKIGDIDDSDSESYVFTFYVPNDIDEGEYQLVIKAYEDDNEEGVCIDHESGVYAQTIDINKESDKDRLIMFEDYELSTSTVPCGSEVTVTTTMYNIGEDRQDAVKANLYSNTLGIDLYSEVFTKFDSDDKQELEFTFTVPKNATEGIYKLSLLGYYDWDEDEDDDETYDDTYFDEKSEAIKLSLTLDGKCSDSSDAALKINVALSDDTPTAKAGKEVILETTIENTGTGDADYEVAVSGISEWAKATIDDNDFTLKAGESKVVEIVLDIDKDAKAGEKEFTIETTYDETTNEQKVLIEIEEGFSLGFGSIGQHFQDNWFIYTVILVDIILIVAIIIAVVRVARKPRA